MSPRGALRRLARHGYTVHANLDIRLGESALVR
jgi:hypothetical protein